MRTLVILGLGARSTLFYQKKLHDMCFDLKGNYATFPFVLKQLNFDTINPYLPDNSTVILPILIDELKEFNLANVFLLVPNITLHKILDSIDFKLNIIHPHKLLASKLAKRKTDNLVFFGTKFTNNNSYISSFIKNPFITKLKKTEILFLDDLRKKVYSNSETHQEILTYNNLIDAYSKNNTVIIACTELSIINNNRSNNVIDLALLQCTKSLEIFY